MSVESNRVLLEHHFKKLRLPTMGREWETLAASCAKEGRDHGDFLLGLTERELIEREQRAAERRIKGAKFPVLKTIDSFDFAAQPTINELLMRQLLSGEYLEARENILLIGNSGTGKTQMKERIEFE
jgi:DNA replication protein DnaC